MLDSARRKDSHLSGGRGSVRGRGGIWSLIAKRGGAHMVPVAVGVSYLTTFVHLSGVDCSFLNDARVSYTVLAQRCPPCLAPACT